LSNIDNYLSSPDVNKNDKVSSDILKNTINQLGGVSK